MSTDKFTQIRIESFRCYFSLDMFNCLPFFCPSILETIDVGGSTVDFQISRYTSNSTLVMFNVWSPNGHGLVNKKVCSSFKSYANGFTAETPQAVKVAVAAATGGWVEAESV